jgi:hypothetical protein
MNLTAAKMADYQNLFNIVIGILGIIGGWWLNAIWTAIKDLQIMDRELAEKVGAIEVLVAGRYVTREEFNSTLSQVFGKLDRIIDAVNQKADK